MNELEKMIRKELQSIPTYLWGGFFPFHVACWRYLISINPSAFKSVNISKKSRINPVKINITDDCYILTRYFGEIDEDNLYEVNSPCGDLLEELFWSDGVVIDILEEFAYFVSNNVDRDKFLSGSVMDADIPQFDCYKMKNLDAEIRAFALKNCR